VKWDIRIVFFEKFSCFRNARELSEGKLARFAYDKFNQDQEKLVRNCAYLCVCPLSNVFPLSLRHEDYAEVHLISVNPNQRPRWPIPMLSQSSKWLLDEHLG
jgi:hypothetical protein